MGSLQLDARLSAAAEMVLEGKIAADIGSDHMHLPAYLVSRGICPGVIATDKAAAACEGGRRYIHRIGLQEQVDIRCGDGLKVLKPQEAATIILTGMGGHLIKDILAQSMEVAVSAQCLVLSPQKNPEILREFLADEGWRITDELMVKEADIYYPLIRAERGAMKLTFIEALYGPCLISSGNTVFLESLRQQLANIYTVMDKLYREKVAGCRIKQLQAEEKIILSILDKHKET